MGPEFGWNEGLRAWKREEYPQLIWIGLSQTLVSNETSNQGAIVLQVVFAWPGICRWSTNLFWAPSFSISLRRMPASCLWSALGIIAVMAFCSIFPPFIWYHLILPVAEGLKPTRKSWGPKFLRSITEMGGIWWHHQIPMIFPSAWWLEPTGILNHFPIILGMENREHHPNWRTHSIIFQRGRSTTNQIIVNHH